MSRVADSSVSAASDARITHGGFRSVMDKVGLSERTGVTRVGMGEWGFSRWKIAGIPAGPSVEDR